MQYHPYFNMTLRLGISSLVLFFAAASVCAQPAPPAAAASPSSILQPSLAEIQGSTSALNVSRWKAPGSVRQATQQDVDSIQRDLSSTLPGLLSQADAAPASLPPSFAVYRNIDALYDVLLRVSETADLAAPSNEASSVANCLQRLEAARSELADSILRISQRNESRLIALEAAARTGRRPEPAAHNGTTVVDDGPIKTPQKKPRRKTAPKKAVQKPSAGTPSTGSPQ